MAIEEAKENKDANKNPVKKEVSGVQEDTMPLSAVEKLLKSTEERMENKFNAMLSKMELSKGENKISKDEAYIAGLEDDWLEVPSVFFAYSINYSIFGDNKRGKMSVPPQGAVKFKPIIRSKRQTSKGVEVISVSSVKIHSRDTSNWLRNHSQFGIAFFENMESAMNIDSGWAQKLIEANQSIQKLSDQQIIARCRQEEIRIGTDVIKMRKALVEKIAERTIDKFKTMQYGELKKSTIDPTTDRQIISKKA